MQRRAVSRLASLASRAIGSGPKDLACARFIPALGCLDKCVQSGWIGNTLAPTVGPTPRSFASEADQDYATVFYPEVEAEVRKVQTNLHHQRVPGALADAHVAHRFRRLEAWPQNSPVQARRGFTGGLHFQGSRLCVATTIGLAFVSSLLPLAHCRPHSPHQAPHSFPARSCGGWGDQGH